MKTSDRPVIGIICKYTTENVNPHNISCMIRQKVLQAVIDYDALPTSIALPHNQRPRQPNASAFNCLTSHERKILEAQIMRCDGLIFQGGQKITDFENEAALFAHRKNIPALGFCSGQTVMASIDTIEIANVDPCVHNIPHQDYVHSASVIPDTLFHRIIGKLIYVVNSRHSKAIVSCSKLKISSIDSDGNAEVIEDPSRDFYLGTRFHPESLYQTDPVMDSIFTAFIKAANSYHIAKSQGTV